MNTRAMTFRVCRDCYEVAECGPADYPDEPRATECDAAWERFDPNADMARDESQDAEFSWSQCDCCRSTLGGARYAYVL